MGTSLFCLAYRWGVTTGFKTHVAAYMVQLPGWQKLPLLIAFHAVAAIKIDLA